MTSVVESQPIVETVVSHEVDVPQSDTGRKRGRFRSRSSAVLVAQLLILVLMLACWELFSGEPGEPYVRLDAFYFSQPSDIIASIQELIDSDRLWSNVFITLKVSVIGFIIGTIAGLVLGLVFGVNRFVGDVARPFISALNSLPKLALVPLFTLWFGITIQAKYAFVALIVFFLVFYNTYAGVKDVRQELLDSLRLMRARRWQLHMKVTIPSAMTWIISGLHISVPYAMVGAVTSEMLAGNAGLGYLLVRSSGQFNTAGVFAALVLLVVMSLGLTGVIQIVEHRLLRWKTLTRR